MVVAGHAQTVKTAVSVSIIQYMSAAHTQEARNAIAGHAKGRAAQHDAPTGSRLSRYGNILVRAGEASLQIDDTSHIKHTGTRALRFGNAIAEGTWLRIVYIIIERGDMIHRTATASNGKATVALSIGKCQPARTELPCITLIDMSVFILCTL